MSDDEEQEEQQPHDLSPYELLRLEKIRRNQAKLEALGLSGGSIGTLAGGAPRKKKNNNKQQRKRSRANAASSGAEAGRRRQPTRSSKRLRDMKENAAESGGDHAVKEAEAAELVADDKGGPQVIDYDYLPQEPDQLDDDEFQVYTSLRAWRLRRKNELEVEPYKICQNRTLCELIRRVRNDPSWGALVHVAPPVHVVETTSKDGKKGTTSKRSEEDVAADLIECWGLGPSKVAADGFGPEMMAVIAEEKNAKLLEASRARSTAGTGRIPTGSS